MTKKHLLISLAIIVLAAGVLLAMGRIPFCKCGIVSVWSSDVTSNQQSQQLADPYTFTHVLHGIVFYFLLWLIFGKRLTVGQRLLLAVGIEAAWEVFENTDFVINRYRSHTFSYDYYGDSVLNSVGDILAMMVGFWLSFKLPWWGSLLVFIGIDGILLLIIRDSLVVNIIMLIHSFEGIKNWQLNAP